MAHRNAASSRISRVQDAPPRRPAPMPDWELPPIPQVDRSNPDDASVEYSAYRTGLSHHRTSLSGHRTDLSEYRTDLSGERTEMSMRRTGMSFQRTRLSAERTLMSVIRTALSLIGFGFTIYQVFSKLLDTPGVKLGSEAPRNFGTLLVGLGIALLVTGIVYHVNYMRELRDERDAMVEEGLIHGETRYPLSFTLVIALLLLALGVMAIISMLFGVAVFG